MAEASNLRRRLAFWKRRRIKKRQSTMTVMDHLRELRTRLIIAGVTFAVISFAAFFFFNPVLDFLLEPLCGIDPARLGPQGCRLITNSPMEGFLTRLKVTAMVGFLFSSPIWLYQVWAFVVPGLHERERRYSLPFVFSSVTLFVIGCTAAYLLLPKGLNVLIALGGPDLVPFFRAQEYLNFVGLTLIVFGVMFEIPLILFFLGLAGIVSPAQLRSARKGSFIGIIVLSAILTPSQDPYTMLGLAIPIYGLYELVIVLLSMIEKRRAKRASL